MPTALLRRPPAPRMADPLLSRIPRCMRRAATRDRPPGPRLRKHAMKATRRTRSRRNSLTPPRRSRIISSSNGLRGNCLVDAGADETRTAPGSRAALTSKVAVARRSIRGALARRTIGVPAGPRSVAALARPTARAAAVARDGSRAWRLRSRSIARRPDTRPVPIRHP